MVPQSRLDDRDERSADTSSEQQGASVGTGMLSQGLTLSPQILTGGDTLSAQRFRSEQSREDLDWMRKLEELGGDTLELSMADLDETASSSHEDGHSDEEGGGPSQAQSSKATTVEAEKTTTTGKRRSSAPVSMNKRRARGRTRGSLSAALGRGPFHISSAVLEDDVAASANAQSAAISEEMAADQRKAQNRLAQREFRQRKQQYIRALEARVELLSSDHDTQVDRLRYTLRGLLDENNQLRQLLASFASFVGLQQIGGPLQRAGMSRQELEELLLHSTSEQRLTDAWHSWPHAQESETLRQIRLESNLPPEGLPESSRLSEQAKANSVRKQQQQKQQEVADSDIRSQKRKASSADESQTKQVTPPNLASGGNTRPATGAAEKGPPMPSSFSRSSSSSSGPQLSYAQSSQRVTNPSESSGSSSLSNALAGYFPVAAFDSAPPQASEPAHAPPAATATPVSAATITFAFTPSAYSGFATPGLQAPNMTPDGNSLFASLFDSSGLANYMNAPRQSMPPTTPSALTSGMPLPMPFQTPPPQQQQQGQSRMFASGLPPTQPQPQHQKIDTETQNVRRFTIMFDRIAKRQREQREQRLSGQTFDTSPSSSTVASELFDLDELRRAMLQLIEQARLYATQPRHTLPRILEPSELQRTQPHDPLIDALPYPAIRTRLIAQQESIDVPEVVEYLLESTILHPGDIFDQANWEVTQRFIFAYPKLVDRAVVENSNRWRASRKERSFPMEDVSTGRT